MTTALEWGEGSASRPGRSLAPGKTRYPLYRRMGGPQGRCGQVRKISPPLGFDHRNVQPVASRYTEGYLHRLANILSMRHPSPSESLITRVWRRFELNVNLFLSACAVLAQHEQQGKSRATKWTAGYMWRAHESKSGVFYNQYVHMKGLSTNIVKYPMLGQILSRIHEQLKRRRVSGNAQSLRVGMRCRSYKKTCLIWVWNLVSYTDRIVCNENKFRNNKTASNN